MVSAASRSRQERSETATYSISFLAGLKANYEIDLWGRIRSAHQAARLDVQATFEEVQTAAISLAAIVAATWYQLAEARAQVHVLESQIQVNKQMLEPVTERFRQGQVHAADVLTQRRIGLAKATTPIGTGAVQAAEAAIKSAEASHFWRHVPVLPKRNSI